MVDDPSTDRQKSAALRKDKQQGRQAGQRSGEAKSKLARPRPGKGGGLSRRLYGGVRRYWTIPRTKKEIAIRIFMYFFAPIILPVIGGLIIVAMVVLFIIVAGVTFFL